MHIKYHKDLLNLCDIARIFNWSIPTVKKYMQQQDFFTTVQVGKRQLYAKTELEIWLTRKDIEARMENEKKLGVKIRKGVII